MTLKSNKVPRLDGLTEEFYRKFWKIIAPELMSMFQYSYDQGILLESVHQGLISLLPKKNKDTHYVKNMRPLTLLNNDYKILAKALDNRLREVLPSLINHDQTGFIKGLKISHNVRKSLDIMDFAVKENIPMLILSIDMEKCFNRLEHKVILETLKYFNFGPNFINWISIIYNDFHTCTQNFGFLSEFWVKGQCLNQGRPLSPGLYVLTAEIMANKLRLNDKIKGIKVNGIEYLIYQFADDIDMYLSFKQETLTETFNVLSGIESSTGLLISYEKTTLYRTGSLAKSNAKLITPIKVNWSNDYINTLGINLYTCKDARDQNILEVIDKMKVVSNMWIYRSMSLMGKVTVINSLMASLFVYKFQVLPVIKESIVKLVEDEIIKFLWCGKRQKIPLPTLQLNKSDGGLGLVNIRMKHKALLCNWITDCKKFPMIRNLAEYHLGPCVVNGHIWEFNLNIKDSRSCFPGKSFWHSLLHMWHEYNYSEPQNGTRVGDQYIWFNSLIRIKN